LELARSLIERATGLAAEGRESSYWGGDYYRFEGGAGEELKLFKNQDIYDGEPIIGNSADWTIALLVEDAETDSPVLQALARAPEHFEKMSEKTYEDGRGDA
jgi:hypothetical protein